MKKKSNQSAELFFTMNSFYFSDRTCFQVQLDFQVFFVVSLGKIADYHEHDNVLFSLIFAPFQSCVDVIIVFQF